MSTTDPAEADPAEDPTGDPTGELSYEQAREELVETVRRLEAGGTTLEDSLALWERGERLAGECERRLEGARRRLEAAIERDADRSDAGAGGESRDG